LPLPCLDFASDDGEKWMGRDLPKSAKLTIPTRITKPQFAFQVLQLKIKLPQGDGDEHGLPSSGDLGRIEGVPSVTCLIMDRPKVGRDCRHRDSTLPKPVQLGMRAIALRFPLQHHLGEQCFTPKSDQALLIQERRMERPETHLQYPNTPSVHDLNWHSWLSATAVFLVPGPGYNDCTVSLWTLSQTR
jgi:hypothetical protein